MHVWNEIKHWDYRCMTDTLHIGMVSLTSYGDRWMAVIQYSYIVCGEGYTSESPVHRVTQYYSSWFIHLLILLLDVLSSILYTLRKEGNGVQPCITKRLVYIHVCTA